MTRSALVIAAALTVTGLAACAPPKPTVLTQQVYACDAIHMPGNELGWCVTWTRKVGTVVTGPRLRYNHELATGQVEL